MTESGLSRVSKPTALEAERADSGDNPHVFMRYETVYDCGFEVVENNLRDKTDGLL